MLTTILHDWHARLLSLQKINHLRCWSECTLRSYWHFATYLACLPEERLVRRVLAWTPRGRRVQGRPRNEWKEMLASFCHVHGLGDWVVAAQDRQAWLAMTEDFISYAKP